MWMGRIVAERRYLPRQNNSLSLRRARAAFVRMAPVNDDSGAIKLGL